MDRRNFLASLGLAGVSIPFLGKIAIGKQPVSKELEWLAKGYNSVKLGQTKEYLFCDMAKFELTFTGTGAVEGALESALESVLAGVVAGDLDSSIANIATNIASCIPSVTIGSRISRKIANKESYIKAGEYLAKGIYSRLEMMLAEALIFDSDPYTRFSSNAYTVAERIYVDNLNKEFIKPVDIVYTRADGSNWKLPSFGHAHRVGFRGAGNLLGTNFNQYLQSLDLSDKYFVTRTSTYQELLDNNIKIPINKVKFHDKTILVRANTGMLITEHIIPEHKLLLFSDKAYQDADAVKLMYGKSNLLQLANLPCYEKPHYADLFIDKNVVIKDTPENTFIEKGVQDEVWASMSAIVQINRYSYGKVSL